MSILTGTTDNDLLEVLSQHTEVRALAGNDTINGALNAVVMYGNLGDDSITSIAADTVFGGLGNDSIDASEASAAGLFYGGEGSDSIRGSADGAVYYGGAGNDQIIAGGSVRIAGGDGNDFLWSTGSAASSTVLGGAGDDTLRGAGPGSLLYGGIGNDDITSTGTGTILGGEGNDRISAFDATGAVTIRGDEGNDRITGSRFGGDIGGGDGDDNIEAFAGGRINGGLGNDYLSGFGSDGAMSIFGGEGNDSLFGGSAADSLYGGNGNDVLYEDGPGDWLYGGAGIDTLQVSFLSFTPGGTPVIFAFQPGGTVAQPGATPRGSSYLSIEQIDITGGSGNDSLTGGSGNDSLRGWLGNDTLDGGGGNDNMIGDNGDDLMIGGAGNDFMQSGSGRDSLYGGDGDDTLYGTHAGSVFAGTTFFAGGAGADTINTRFSSSSILTYANSAGGVYVDLPSGRGYGADAQGDVLIGGFAQVYLSEFNDSLVGGAEQFGLGGDDVLVQTAGTRAMTGGGDADTFTFTTDLAFIFENTLITDYSAADGDLIDLRQIDARPATGDQAFAFIGTSAFTGANGQLRYEYDADSDRTVVELTMVGGDDLRDYWFYIAGNVALEADMFRL